MMIEDASMLSNLATTEPVSQGLSTMRIDKLRRHVIVAILSAPMFLASGCASAPFCDDSNSCTTGDGSCLPVDVSDAPPNASINMTHRCVDPVPKDAIPAPVGTYVNQWRGAMSQGAQEQHWILTRNEWFDGGSKLGPEGKKHVARIAQCLATEPHNVVIETEPVALALGQSYDDAVRSNQELQAERRNAIVMTLLEAGVPDADQRVVFADDRSVGVRGIESPDVVNRQFSSGGNGNRGGIGRGQGQGGIGGGGFGGGGFGGGGIF